MSDEKESKIPRPPAGSEYLYHVLQRIEEMYEATVGPGSPVKGLQKELAEFKREFLSDTGPIGKLRAEVTKVHNDYISLHNLMSREHDRNEDRWRRVDQNWEMLKDEVEKLKLKETVQDKDIADVKTDVVELKRDVEELKRKVG